MTRPSWTVVAAVAAAVVLSTGAATPAAWASTASATGRFCGAGVTLATYRGVVQYHYIVDDAGRATQAHNGGCFGISSRNQIWWTPRTNPKWRLMPGGGIAVKVGRSYLGNACPPGPSTCPAFAAPTVTVITAAGHSYGQTWDPFLGRWGGHWYRV